MLLHISEQSSETLQEQIRGQIRSRVLNGDLEPDHALPSIRSLAKVLKVSVITVQRAYESLLNEEILYARKGKGFFVAALAKSDKFALAQQRLEQGLESLLDNARRNGLSDDEIRQAFDSKLLAGD